MQVSKHNYPLFFGVLSKLDEPLTAVQVNRGVKHTPATVRHALRVLKQTGNVKYSVTESEGGRAVIAHSRTEKGTKLLIALKTVEQYLLPDEPLQ